MRPLAMGLVAIVAGMALAGAAGCALAPLSRDQQVEALLKENRRIEDLLIASEQKLAQVTPPGTTLPERAPPKTEDPFRAVRVQFGKYTDVVNTGGKPTDERLKVVLEPIDAEGDTVKRAGSLELEVFEAGAATPKLYGVWKFAPEELAQTWLSGLGAYAYVLKLPWPGGRAPQSDRLLLKAKFATIGGEVLPAETTLVVSRAAKGPKGGGEKAPAPPAKPPAKKGRDAAK